MATKKLNPEKQGKNRQAETRFQPGKSGNPKGRPANAKYLSDFLRQELKEIESVTKKTYAQLIAERAVHDAVAGKPEARALVWERTEGKVLQPIGGDPEQPLEVNIEHTIDTDKGLIQEAVNRLCVRTGADNNGGRGGSNT